ncbi:hypothetical protein HUU05_20685 [candidate division KSB1 bacterium]|nr:hypothetical protein [candidate division KSB1 bacterium]
MQVQRSLTKPVAIALWTIIVLRVAFISHGSARLYAQTGKPLTVRATSMLRSAEVFDRGDHVHIYGKQTLKTYVYYRLSALPFREFQLHVEAAGDVTGPAPWPKIGIAFDDTVRIVKEVEIPSAAFQTYDFGALNTTGHASLYFIFTNDYYDAARNADVNLKIRQAVLTSAATRDTFVVQGQQLRLLWNPNREADLAGYKIYHGLQPGKYLAPITVSKDSTSHLFKVDAGYKYFFAVAAFDTARNQSALSPEIMAQVQPATILANSDLNGDGKCDALDIQIFSRAFGSTCAGARYNNKADFNGDCKIDGQDQLLFSKNCK